MLIDETYFQDPLTIAQLGQPTVVASVRAFIARWEPKIMEAALGYDFYQAFLAGLDVDSDAVIDQRWLDLLNGVSFHNQSQYRRRWVGFAGGSAGAVVKQKVKDDLFIYAGTTAGFPAGGYQYTNAALAGQEFTLEVFGEGTWEPGIEWNYKDGGGIALVDTGYTTTPGERWVLHFKTVTPVTTPTDAINLESPLAGFIYYEYQRKLITQSTGSGEVKNQGENSVAASPAQKMVDAYNEACEQIGVLYDFLWTDKSKVIPIYPEFDTRQIDAGGYFGWFGCGFENWWYNDYFSNGYSFSKINTFGI